MKQSIGYVALVVRDYDEAIEFYVNTLGFRLVEDTFIAAQDKRWVLVAPPGSTETRLLLARAVGTEQSSRIGNQTGGRVSLFLHTDDFGAIFTNSKAKAWSSSASPKKKATGPSRCSETCMAICGICCSSSPSDCHSFSCRSI